MIKIPIMLMIHNILLGDIRKTSRFAYIRMNLRFNYMKQGKFQIKQMEQDMSKKYLFHKTFHFASGKLSESGRLIRKWGRRSGFIRLCLY